MSNWNDIASIYKLSIYISNGEKSTSIYANGNNQIPVDIIIEARDKKITQYFYPAMKYTTILISSIIKIRLFPAGY
ncbi:hypothetical protein [Yersinia sp. 2545 StPb PI]|uniref:hypothetical protein n=1 Tax=unclassified Yersinia (in: enterobacteria) TaxID=2653513 RepID=UPI003FA4AE3E